MKPDVRVRRVYEDPAPDDGARVLVDRIWPRGVRKDAVRLDEWAKDVAPSDALRAWYGHDPAKFGEFRRRYLDELAGEAPCAALGWLRQLVATRTVTLLTATRDVAHSQAAVLAQLLRGTAGQGTAERRTAERGDGDPDAPGDAVCWAHLVCPECGGMTSEGHRDGCALTPR